MRHAALLMGSGGGRFARRIPFSPGFPISQIMTGDWNHDDRADFAFVKPGPPASGSLVIARSTISGGYELLPGLALGIYPSQIASGDYDGDHNTDLAVNCIGSNEVYVFHGRADGAFEIGPRVATGYPTTVAFGDVNQDGRDDLVTLELENSGSYLATYVSGAGGSFGARVISNISRYVASGIMAADFTGDGRADIAFAFYQSSAGGAADLGLMRGVGDGTFTSVSTVGHNPLQSLEVFQAADFIACGRGPCCA